MSESVIDGDVAEALPMPTLARRDFLVSVLGAGFALAVSPVETVEELRNAIQAAHGPSQIHIYPNAPHAFFADYRPSYRKEEAEDGWQRLKKWFRDHGV